MSVTIELLGKEATLADRQWRSADQIIQGMLNDHLDSLAIPAHYPPQEQEHLAATAAARDYGARIIRNNPDPLDTSRNANHTIKVY